MKEYNEDDKRVSLSLLFSIYIRLNHKYLSKKLKNSEVSSVMLLPILIECYDKDGIHQKNLNKHLNRDNALLTRQLRQLEDDGLINRREDNENRRENIISLTEKGSKIARDQLKIQSEREEEIIKGSGISLVDLKAIMIYLIENSIEYNEKYLK